MFKMEIKTFTDINDPYLKSEWESLENDIDIFPQSSWHWCATWWQYLAGRRKLHVVMVVDENGEALGIAPLCVERSFGISVLRSFPIHFGDFYTFITIKEDNKRLSAIQKIFDYILSYKQWHWVRLEQVNEMDWALIKVLHNSRFISKKMTGVIIADFVDYNWDEYLQKLSRNVRQNTRKMLRKICREFDVELKIIDNWIDYEQSSNEMFQIHNNRWEGSASPDKGVKEIECWQQAVKEQFQKHKVCYFKLLFNGETAAYRLGFLLNGIFYDWHTGFNRKYSKYRPGGMLLAFMVQYFMDNHVTKINFMAGEYKWKYDWSPEREVQSNLMFTSPSVNLFSFLLNNYYHKLRDRLKFVYHQMMGFEKLRSLSRTVLIVKQKINGYR